MNRICAAFSDIGNINLANAKVAPFNYQMLLSGPCSEQNLEACNIFCAMDDINKSGVIESQDCDYSQEREEKANYDLLANMIVEELVDKFGSLEYVYPFICKFLFTGKNADKATHKQMFWRIFGNIAKNNIIKNLKDYRTCDICGMKIPAWVKTHVCPKENRGFVECVDCHNIVARTNSKQCRCPSCQDEFKKNQNALSHKNRYKLWKETKEQRITSLVSRFEKT